MKSSEVRTLLDYHYWARDRMLDAVEALTPEQFTRELGGSFRSVRDTLAHTYGAEWIWYARWHGETPTALPTPDTFPDFASLRQAWRDHERRMRTFIEGLDDHGLERVISYKLLNGTPGASVLWHMIQHVVNHASYHRGQVTTLLRQLGAAPPKSTDLITYYREMGTKSA
jgi:uncharacterized damage-inducible protein DinB